MFLSGIIRGDLVQGENDEPSGTEYWEPETWHLFPSLWKDELFDKTAKIVTLSKWLSLVRDMHINVQEGRISEEIQI